MRNLSYAALVIAASLGMQTAAEAAMPRRGQSIDMPRETQIDHRGNPANIGHGLQARDLGADPMDHFAPYQNYSPSPDGSGR